MGASGFLLRTLFPSWRFFDDNDFIPRLFYRTRAISGEFSEWQRGLQVPSRGFFQFPLNPSGNNSLALYTLLDRLVQEVNAAEDSSQLASSVTYRLLERWVRLHVRRDLSVAEFEFKVQMMPTKGQSDSPQLLRSLLHEVETYV